jgi:hypothetical protein
VFTARYALSPCIKQICFVFKRFKIRRGRTRSVALATVCEQHLTFTYSCGFGDFPSVALVAQSALKLDLFWE